VKPKPARFIVRCTDSFRVFSSASTLELPASAPEMLLPTSVPMAWNSGMVANWTPVYGTGLSVGESGLAVWMASWVTRANGVAFMYSALA